MPIGEAVVKFGWGGGGVLGEEKQRALSLGQVGLLEDAGLEIVQSQSLLCQDLGDDGGEVGGVDGCIRSRHW